MTKHFMLRLSQPSCLLNHLGAYSRLDSLLELPEIAAVDAASVRQSRSEEPYLVHLDTHGLSLTLQCMNPGASPQELLWGLQGLHVNALQCKILDSDGHRAHEMTSDGVLQLFGIHSGDESVMHIPPLLCFQVEGIDKQTLGVTAIFDESSKKLSTLSLVRIGNWRPLPEPIRSLTPAPAAPLASPPASSYSAKPMMCRSGEHTPQSGTWEGRLPPSHPQAALFNDAPHRFVYKRSGDAMGTLGLPPFDEAMVVWTWLRSQ